MTNDTDIYRDLYQSLVGYLLRKSPTETKVVTKTIKDFFRSEYEGSHTVLCGHAEGNEFLADVLVATYNPKATIRQRTLELSCQCVSTFLAIESELGGVGASSPYGVMKNVVEDFLKLLVLRSKYRVMIFTSLPYSNEKDHVVKRVQVLRDLYSRTEGISGGVLLVHLAGSQPKSKQVQVRIAADTIRGFVISSDGQSASEVVAKKMPPAPSGRA